jgi:hypothetical protein
VSYSLLGLPDDDLETPSLQKAPLLPFNFTKVFPCSDAPGDRAQRRAMTEALFDEGPCALRLISDLSCMHMACCLLFLLFLNQIVDLSTSPSNKRPQLTRQDLLFFFYLHFSPPSADMSRSDVFFSIVNEPADGGTCYEVRDYYYFCLFFFAFNIFFIIVSDH